MVTYEIDLSVDADYMYSAPAMKQYDSESRQLRMRLFDRSGENIATKSGQKYRMRGLKPDGQPVYVKADTEGEYVVYTLDPQVLTAVGTVLMDVEILKADDESFLLSSQLIAIEVEPAALSHEKLKSDSVITAIAGIGADTIASERVIAAIAEKARKQEKLLDGIEAAEKARQQAEEGRATAEGKRAEGESARAAAESGRSTAEEERAKKEEERKGAESSRQEAEVSRAEAERRRSESEKARAEAETARIGAESTRAAAESSRLDAEKARETAEEGRKAAESGRVDAESQRSDAETKRATAEAARVGAESTRESAESLRAEKEKERGTSEGERQSKEAERQDEEKKRQGAESTRASSEQARAESESERKAAEVLRKSAESERAEAEAKRQEAESTRKDAEKARASAEALREESEKARVTAESSRVSEHATSHQTATEDHAKILAVLDTIKKLETGEIVAKVAELESKGATKEYVRAQISALIDGAPQDLDTLKELADALKARGDTEEILTKLGSKIDRTQLDEELKQLDSKLTNLIGSKAAQSDLISGLAGKVNNADFDTYKSEAAKAIADKVSASNFSAYKEETTKLIASKAGESELEGLKQAVGDDLQAKLEGKIDKSKVYTGDYSGANLSNFEPSKSIAPISVAGAENLAAKIISSLPQPCLTGTDLFSWDSDESPLVLRKEPGSDFLPKGKIVSTNDALTLIFWLLQKLSTKIDNHLESSQDPRTAIINALSKPDRDGIGLTADRATHLAYFGAAVLMAVDRLIYSEAFTHQLKVLGDVQQLRKMKEDLEAAKADQAYLLTAHRNGLLNSSPIPLRQIGASIDKKATNTPGELIFVDEVFSPTYVHFPKSIADVLFNGNTVGKAMATRLSDSWQQLNADTSKPFIESECSFPRLVYLAVYNVFQTTVPFSADSVRNGLSGLGLVFLLDAIEVSRANLGSQFYGRPANWLVGLLGGILAAVVHFITARGTTDQSADYFNVVVSELYNRSYLRPVFEAFAKIPDGKPSSKAAFFVARLQRMTIASAKNELETESLTKRDPNVSDALYVWGNHLPIVEKYAHALVRGKCLSGDLNSEYEPEKEDDGND